MLLVDIDSPPRALAPEVRLATYERIRQRVLSIPGVSSAGLSAVAPLSGALWTRRIAVSGSRFLETTRSTGPEGFGFSAAPLPSDEPLAAFNAISPGWLATYRTNLLAGRDIDDHDSPTSARVVLVNQAFVRKFLNGANPIGRTVHTLGAEAGPSREIVGLVNDAVYRDVREPTLPTVYVPLAQYDTDATPTPPVNMTLAVRFGHGVPSAITRSTAAAVSQVAPMVAVTVRPLAEQVSDTFVQERLLAMLSAFFGALALLIAGVGLYGVTAYTVNRRRPEIGIRVALGATRVDILRLVLGRVFAVVGGGIVLGLIVSVWASRFVASMLYGIEGADKSTVISAAVVLGMSAAIAAWLPAYRASRLNPATVLRDI